MRAGALRLATFAAALGSAVLAAAVLRGEPVHVAAVVLAVAMGLPLGVGPAVALLRALGDAPSAGDDAGGNRASWGGALPALQLLGLPPVAALGAACVSQGVSGLLIGAGVGLAVGALILRARERRRGVTLLAAAGRGTRFVVRRDPPRDR